MANQKIDVATILSKAASAARLNLISLLVTALLVSAPVYVLWHPDIYRATYESIGPSALNILSACLGWIVCSCLLYGAFQGVAGKCVGIGTTFSQGLRLAVPVLPLTIILGLADGLLGLAYIVPGIVFVTLFTLTIPIAIVERPGWAISMWRSFRASSDIWPTLFTVWGLLLGAGAMVDLVCSFDEVCHERVVVWVVEWLLVFLWPLIAIVFACSVAVAYAEIRRRDDGISVEQLAQRLDRST